MIHSSHHSHSLEPSPLLTAWFIEVHYSHSHTRTHTQLGVSDDMLPTVRVITPGPYRLIEELFLWRHEDF